MFGYIELAAVVLIVFGIITTINLYLQHREEMVRIKYGPESTYTPREEDDNA